MTIRINQVPIDFTLEQEKTLAELARSLEKWAADQDWTVVSFLADGKDFALDDDTPLSSISDFEMEAVPAQDRDRAALNLVVQFFGALSEEPVSGWDSYRGEYRSLRPVLLGVLGPSLPRLAPALEALDGPWDEAPLRAASLEVRDEALRLVQEYDDPRGHLRGSLDRLDASLGSLEELGLLFQTGRDKDGFALIVGLLEVLDTIGRQASLYFRRQPGKEAAWRTVQTELQPFLLEAETALKAGDYVLLTDLFEYELCPRLGGLRESFAGTDILDPAPGVL